MNYGCVISKIKSHFANSFLKFLNWLDQELGKELSNHEKDNATQNGGCGGPQDFFEVAHVLDAQRKGSIESFLNIKSNQFAG